MKVFALMVIAAFLVVGIKSDVTSIEGTGSAEEVGTTPGTDEIGQTDTTVEPWSGSYLLCYSLKLVLETSGMMVNGSLDETKSDNVVDLLRSLQILKVKPDELESQRIRNCTRTGNLQTDECKVAGAFFGCLQSRENTTTPVPQNVN